MLCPFCGKRTDSHKPACQHCGRSLRAPRRPAPQEPGTPQAPLHVYDDAAYVRPPRRRRPAGDAPVGNPDARVGNPDARVGSPDARVGSPDARVGGADARVGGADAQVGGAQARRVRVRHSPRRQDTRRADEARLEQLLRRGPVRRRRVRWGRLVGGVSLLAAFLLVGVTLLLTRTASGQLQLAAWGYDVPASAYVGLGDSLLDRGDIAGAIEAYERAREIDPASVEAALDLGAAYEVDGRQEQAMAIYQELMDTLAPQHAEAYTRMIRIYRDAGNAQAAVDLMLQAYEATGQASFETMRREYMPTAPTASYAAADEADQNAFELKNNRSNYEFDVTLSAQEGVSIYYTLDGEAPGPDKSLYEAGQKIRCAEGTTHLRAVAVSAQGVLSQELDETYTVVIPTPNSPKANYASGPYSRVISVSLRADEGTAAIYYTLDGTSPTTQSLLYEGPITLPVGDSTLKAIAVMEDGRQSYEMTCTYAINVTQKRVFRTADAFDGLALMETTYASFVKKYGEPLSYERLEGENAYAQGESYEGVWAQTTARFVSLEGADAVLYCLFTQDASLKGPRSTRVGSEAADVTGAFRDKGGMPINERGDRLLYNIDSLGQEIGTYRVLDGGGALIEYYCPAQDEGCYLQLTYAVSDGVVESILWQQYVGVTAQEGE